MCSGYTKAYNLKCCRHIHDMLWFLIWFMLMLCITKSLQFMVSQYFLVAVMELLSSENMFWSYSKSIKYTYYLYIMICHISFQTVLWEFQAYCVYKIEMKWDFSCTVEWIRIYNFRFLLLLKVCVSFFGRSVHVYFCCRHFNQSILTQFLKRLCRELNNVELFLKKQHKN